MDRVSIRVNLQSQLKLIPSTRPFSAIPSVLPMNRAIEQLLVALYYSLKHARFPLVKELALLVLV